MQTLNQEVRRSEVPHVAPDYILENNSGITETFKNVGMVPKWVAATFDPSGDSTMRTAAAHGLGMYIPDNAIVIAGFVDVITTFQSTAGGTDLATIALHLQSADDFVAAISIAAAGDVWDAGLHGCKIGYPNLGADAAHDSQVEVAALFAGTFLKMTARRELTATVATAALTAGKANIYVCYLTGE